MSQKLPPQRIIANTLTVFLRERIKDMKSELDKNKITETNSELNKSIELVETKIQGNEYTAQITMEDYYVFIDQGVKGIGKAAHDDKPMRKATGAYQFRTPNVNRKMVDSIREWGSRKPRAGVTKKNMNSVAFLTAKKVKRLGIEQTLFFTNATTDEKLKKLDKMLQDNLGDALINQITL